MGMVEDAIRRKLTEEFSPQELLIENESHRHAGHAGSPGTGESHFKVVIVADCFDSLGRVERQRRIYQVLSEELRGAVHALSLSVWGTKEKQG